MVKFTHHDDLDEVFEKNKLFQICNRIAFESPTRKLRQNMCSPTIRRNPFFFAAICTANTNFIMTLSQNCYRRIYEGLSRCKRYEVGSERVQAINTNCQAAKHEFIRISHGEQIFYFL